MRIFSIYLGACVLASTAQAQSVVRVRGVAYDSLHNVTLGDAFVTMTGAGRTRSVTSDVLGRFVIDSVVPGTYTLSMQHAAIDSLGFSGFSSRAVVTDGKAEVRVSVPSFGTLWRSACGGAFVPIDSGFVFGVVRDAAGQAPVAGAKVELTWIDMSVNVKTFAQRRFRATAVSDARGNYGVCGVPLSINLNVRASADTRASGSIDLPPRDARIQRRDLLVAPSGLQGRGIVAGQLTDGNGRPFRDGRVVIDTMPEVRSGLDGRFIVRNVPAGTRQVEFTSIGMRPVVMTIDVTPSDTTRVSAVLGKVTLLDTMKVVGATALKREFVRGVDERRRSGMGTMKDSSQIAKYPRLESAFDGFPSLKVKRGPTNFSLVLPAAPFECEATLYIDRRRAQHYELMPFSPADIALIEVYTRRSNVPTEFQTPTEACGVVLVWTKNGIQ